MNIISHWIIAHTGAEKLARTCSKCGKTRVIAPSKLKETVACKSCGSPLPPPSSAT